MSADRKGTHRRNKVNVRLSIVIVIKFEMMFENRSKRHNENRVDERKRCGTEQNSKTDKKTDGTESLINENRKTKQKQMIN
jgi:hypothetical protein